MNELKLQELYFKQKHDKATEAYRKTQLDLEHVRAKIREEELKQLGDVLPMYARRLGRLKKYIEKSCANSVHYAFHKVGPHVDDYHEIVHDPIDWKIADYDLLAMESCVDILFDYSIDAVREFIRDWMKENVPHARETDNLFKLKTDNEDPI